jgi:hypothetical protein
VNELVTIVDPPGGWRFGFPKPLDETIPYEEFLLKNGYPKEDIDLALNYSRYWTSSDWPE